MVAFFRKHKIAAVLAGIAFAVLLIAAWVWAAPIRGRLAAHYDIARGHYRQLTYGLPVEWLPEYRELLKRRYRVDCIAVAGCTISPGLISYVEGYNAVSTAAVNKHFGHDVFNECARDAQRSWNARQPMEQMFPNAPQKTKSADCFRAFSHRTSVHQVVQACGRPGEDPCSGLFCFVWHLDDGNTIVIGTPYLERIDRVTLTDKSGKQSSLLQNEWNASVPPTTLRHAQ